MDETLIRIEEAQAGLRDSIERTRGLTEETERLVLKHRTEVAKPSAAQPEAAELEAAPRESLPGSL